MKKLVIAAICAFAASIATTDSASAQNGMGFLPYGYYQPYGARYGTSIRTPPYFATNPPVYYGSRHARPYGLSPYASLPMVKAGDNYTSRLSTEFEHPPVETPGPACRSVNSVYRQSTVASKIGPVRQNPFVDTSTKVAKN